MRFVIIFGNNLSLLIKTLGASLPLNDKSQSEMGRCILTTTHTDQTQQTLYLCDRLPLDGNQVNKKVLQLSNITKISGYF